MELTQGGCSQKMDRVDKASCGFSSVKDFSECDIVDPKCKVMVAQDDVIDNN